MSTYDIILQQLVNGLLLGSFYSLVALGYSMVYGIIKLLNFAHGDIYMSGAFVGLVALSLLSGVVGAGWVGILISMVFSMLAVGLLGVLIQRVAYRPLLNAPRLSILITAIGVSLVLYNTVMVITDGEFSARVICQE
jgi:branched-chain amino acid transport system permease protein